MKDHTHQVVKFCKEQDILLDKRRAHTFRMIPPGVYTHQTLPLGSSRIGITDGVTAHILWSDGVCREVHLKNLDVKLDSPPSTNFARKVVKKAATTTKKPRKSKLAAILDELMNDL